MKKWHMEGIVGYSGSNQRKLSLPNLRAFNLHYPDKLHEPRKEFYVTRVLRYCASLFVKYF